MTADFVCRLSQHPSALVWRTPSRLYLQTHSDLPTNCWNKVGELNSEEPTHFTSLQMVMVLTSPWACKHERGKAPDFILTAPSYSYYPLFPSMRKGNIPL